MAKEKGKQCISMWMNLRCQEPLGHTTFFHIHKKGERTWKWVNHEGKKPEPETIRLQIPK